MEETTTGKQSVIKPAYRSKHEDVKKKKKRLQNHRMWGRK